MPGFNEPDAVAVIGRSVARASHRPYIILTSSAEKGQSEVEYTFHLFVRPKDEKAELWDGARSGVQAAQDVFNADEAGEIDSVSSKLSQMIMSASSVFTDIGYGVKTSAFKRFIGGSPKVDGLASLLQKATVKLLRPLMNELRVTKSEAEIRCMRKAGTVSGAAFTWAMQNEHKSEKQLWADLAYAFQSQGLDNEAYVPVIAGGSNALSIHYVRNDALLDDGDLVLVDAGGEYGGYITDITRTWPVNGRFTDAQRDMYNMVLKVQKSCISLCREDADMSLDKLHRVAENGLSNGLKDLGFNMSGNALEQLFPHHVGHYIGLDVHDAPGYPRTDRLRKNHCITIEPGVYVPNDERWPTHFRGMGIRIEDSVRIGSEEVDVFTSAAVKDVEAIEGLRS